MATTMSAGVLSGVFFSLGCGGGASLCGHVQQNFVIKIIQLNKGIFFCLVKNCCPTRFWPQSQNLWGHHGSS